MVKIVSKIVFLALVVFSLLTFSYPAETLALWAKRFDNNGWSEFGGVWPTESGGYYLWGTTHDPFEPYETRKSYLLLSRLDASGNVLWTNKIYTGDYDNLFISELGSNNFFLQGWTSLTQGGDRDPVWAKYTVNPANGAMTKIFGKVFKGSGDDSLSFAISESGDIGIGTGVTNSFSGKPNDDDMLVVKIDSSTGEKEWSKVFDHGLKDHNPTVIPISGG
jgi:hypothetical protein